MQYIGNAIKSVWARLLSLTSRKIFFLFAWILVIIGILALFKYVFLTNCVTIGNIKECATSNVNSSDTLFALGGVLVAILAIIPTFWNERRIEDAKKDIERKIFDSVREDMNKVVQAQAILSSLPETYPDTFAGYTEMQSNIERAVTIWPPLKQSEHRGWGIRLAEAIFYGVHYPADLKTWIVTNAVRFLEESVASDPDAEALLYLACMYGYRDEYDAMIASTKKAVKLDEDIKEQFQGNAVLLILLKACGNNRDHMEKLGNSIGLELPISQEGFCRTMRKVDWVAQRGTFINWTAIKKPGRTGDQGRFIIKVMAANDLNGEEVYASCYHQDSMGGNVYVPETKIGDRDNQVTLEKLYEELDKTFLLICMSKV
jgi:hypothetical protein